eukprot:COSAG04_NODE_326_length_16774_cov_39.129115_9_plen_103_part_00
MSTAGRERVEAAFYQQLSAAGTEMPHEKMIDMAASDIEKQIFDITGYTFEELYHQADNAAASAGGDQRPGAAKGKPLHEGKRHAGRLELLGMARQALFFAVR